MPNTNHLAVYSRKRRKDYIDLIFSGAKTVDIKLSQRRTAPYEKIVAGDMLYIKESGGPVIGRVLISNVQYYEIRDPFQILELLESIRDAVGLEDEEQVLRMFEKVKFNRYVTIFELSKPQPLKTPIRIEKFDRRVWVTNYHLPIDLSLVYGEEY